MPEIALTKGFVTTVDESDYEMLGAYRWHAAISGGRYYAKHSLTVGGKSRPLWMHRLITNCPEGMVVDHIDGDPLNNCRSNLRIVTHAQNLQNQRKSRKKGKHSAYKGVVRVGSKWRVSLCANMVKIFGPGLYDTDEEAARAYDVLARKNFGEFARLNFPS